MESKTAKKSPQPIFFFFFFFCLNQASVLSQRPRQLFFNHLGPIQINSPPCSTNLQRPEVRMGRWTQGDSSGTEEPRQQMNL